MREIDQVSCGDDFTDAATISDVWGSNGGFFQIFNNDVLLRLQFGKQGMGEWTQEVHASVGNGILAPHTTGIQFRNHSPGQVAVVSAALAYPAEPPLALVAGGQSGAASTGGGTQSIPIILNGAGVTTLVAAVVGEVVKVRSCYCMSGGTTTLQFKSSGGNPLTGVLNFVNATGFVLNEGDDPWMTTVSGEGLTITNTNNVVVGGVLTYEQVSG